jgi:2,3,4,5-tetrahydropyridine-2,6-dicarboxylate N-succinyltransferase
MSAENTMVDTWATVGSCAQIGANCHLSGGVGIGGVLEPLQAGPVIIEDNCFIGARSEVVEGVIVERRRGAVDGRVHRRTTKIVDRATGEVIYRPRAGLFGGGSRLAARQAAARRHARPVAVLRGDRQARRCADAREDRSTSCCVTSAQALIAAPA